MFAPLFTGSICNGVHAPVAAPRARRVQQQNGGGNKDNRRNLSFFICVEDVRRLSAGKSGRASSLEKLPSEGNSVRDVVAAPSHRRHAWPAFPQTRAGSTRTPASCAGGCAHDFPSAASAEPSAQAGGSVGGAPFDSARDFRPPDNPRAARLAGTRGKGLLR